MACWLSRRACHTGSISGLRFGSDEAISRRLDVQSTVIPAAPLPPIIHLRLCQLQLSSELFALLTDDVVVVLEGVLQLKQLGRSEGCPYALWFAKRLEKEAGMVMIGVA